jgi:hypothetical protein
MEGGLDELTCIDYRQFYNCVAIKKITPLISSFVVQGHRMIYNSLLSSEPFLKRAVKSTTSSPKRREYNNL